MTNVERMTPELLKEEEKVYLIADEFVRENNSKGLVSYLNELKLLSIVPKSRAAKIVRHLIDKIGLIKNSEKINILVCEKWINWSKTMKRDYLRQRLQLRLARLYLITEDYTSSLDTISLLITEIKKLDDKLFLVEVHLLESKIRFKLRDIPRARASLTGARTSATAVYCPPKLQSELDLHGAIVSAAERDYKTAFSYFYEAFEGFSSLISSEEENLQEKEEFKNAELSLKGMLICKILQERASEVMSILNTKTATLFHGRSTEALILISQAHSNKSLVDFNNIRNDYSDVLGGIIKEHMDRLYDFMFEKNLIKLIEPFSRVEVSHIAFLIGLNTEIVENKISRMILDGQLPGILDQESGCLIVYDKEITDRSYFNATKVLSNLDILIDSLFDRVHQLNL